VTNIRSDNRVRRLHTPILILAVNGDGFMCLIFPFITLFGMLFFWTHPIALILGFFVNVTAGTALIIFRKAIALARHEEMQRRREWWMRRVNHMDPAEIERQLNNPEKRFDKWWISFCNHTFWVWYLAILMYFLFPALALFFLIQYLL